MRTPKERPLVLVNQGPFFLRWGCFSPEMARYSAAIPVPIWQATPVPPSPQ